MQITDLSEKYHQDYFCCLESWSDEMKEAGDHKETWYQKMKDKGLGVKIAIENDEAVGMIQYLPAEHSIIDGHNIYFIICIWVHGYKKKGVGNHQRKGIGKALLQAAEEDVRSRNADGIAAWGLKLPIWMKASWFRKQGYKKVDKNGMALLMFKPFKDDAVPPKWIKQKKKPAKTPGKVDVTVFNNGWCPAQNLIYERAKKAANEIGNEVEFKVFDTSDRYILEEWGISDDLFIDGKKVRNGPPPSYEKIERKIAKRVKRL
nr:GNAT family N-acetyltransferase [Bacteroidota bacterium]